MAIELSVDDNHPLSLEIASLRNAVAHYQHEAHTISVKLQRHVYETSYVLDRNQVLERDNARLMQEITILRDYPDTSPYPAVFQVPELTLALRRLSDKLTLVEMTLLDGTAALADASSHRATAQHEAEAAYETASRALARVQECEKKQRELERKAKAAEEERDLADIVVQEYADLVRSLWDKKTGSSLPSINGLHLTPKDVLSEGRSGLHRLLQDFNVKIEELESDIGRLQGELTFSQDRGEAYRRSAAEDRTRMAQAQFELEKLRMDDSVAAKMVARYMRFSQSSTDALQHSLEILKVRQGATLATLSTQIEQLQNQLSTERRQADKLRIVLDELTEDISRETYGRRREVSLRLALISREEGINEGLRRLLKKVIEASERVDIAASFNEVLKDAEGLLDTLNGQPSQSNGSPGSLARILTSQEAVSALVQELQAETEKRLELQRRISELEFSHRCTTSSPPLPSKDTAVPFGSGSGHDKQAGVLPEVSKDSSTLAALDFNEQIVIHTSIESDKNAICIQSSESPLQSDPGPESTAAVATDIASLFMVTAPLQDLSSVVAETATEAHSRSSVTPFTPAPDLWSGSGIAVGVMHISPPKDPGVSGDESSPATLQQPATSTFMFPSLSQSKTSTPNSPSTDSTTINGHPLLSELQQVRYRYDDLQHAFRDCYIALKELKKDVARVYPSSPGISSMNAVLHTAVQRLDDFSEDARVELEICLIDEERVARGYETLLAVPGAISTKHDEAKMMQSIRAFVDGTDKSILKARQQFNRKLADLEHDITSVKRYIQQELPSSHSPSGMDGQLQPSWPSLTSFLAPSRPVSPGTAPTFGSVMTTPWLRHTPTLTHVRQSTSSDPNPFSILGLRIPMPAVWYTPPTRAHLLTLSKPSRRPRTSSSAYLLGLGSRTGLLGEEPMSQEPLVISPEHMDVLSQRDDVE